MHKRLLRDIPGQASQEGFGGDAGAGIVDARGQLAAPAGHVAVGAGRRYHATCRGKGTTALLYRVSERFAASPAWFSRQNGW